MNSAYEAVKDFEWEVSSYAGAPFGVAVNSCTNALLLSVLYRLMEGKATTTIVLPRRTYVGVAYAVLAAGAVCRFKDVEWAGAYPLYTRKMHYEGGYVDVPLGVVDAARRFTSGMYEPGTFYCLSFHETKILSIGDGGMILTDDWKAAKTLRKMRFDGRTIGVHPKHDTFDVPGFHCHMKPDVATRGLMLMAGMPEYNDDLPTDDYPDLSRHTIFQMGWQ